MKILLAVSLAVIALVSLLYFAAYKECSVLTAESVGKTYTSPAIHAGNEHLLTAQQKDMIEAFSSGEVRQVCFAPGTPEVFQEAMDAATQIAKTLNGGPQVGGAFFSGSSRWEKTAVNGTAVGDIGDPITLTWGIVPDGTAIGGNPFSGESTGPSDLRARLSVIYSGNESEWLQIFQDVFDGWEAKTGIIYIYEEIDDGASMGQGGSVGIESGPNTRPDIRIGGRAIDGDSGVLAYNYFPSNGDMVIDTADVFYVNNSGNQAVFHNIISHEHGHGLALGHVCPKDGTKVMEPVIDTSPPFIGPQLDDIRGANEGYGDRMGANNTSGTAAPISIVFDVLSQETDLSIDQTSEVDYFRVNLTQVGALTVIAKPIGDTYLHGAAVGSSCSTSSPLNPKTMQNLVVTIYDTDGTTVLRAVNNAGLGGDEIAPTVIDSSGEYYIAISSSGGSGVQMYDLDILLSDGVLSLGVPTDATGVSFFDANLNGASIKYFDVGSQSYADAIDLNTQVGYFVKFTPSYAPTFPGVDAVAPISFALAQGWNLLSIPSGGGASWDSGVIQVERGGATVSLATAARTEGWVYEYAWVYNDTLGDYEAVYNSGVLNTGTCGIQAGENFWFYAQTTGVTLIFPAGSLPLNVCEAP